MTASTASALLLFACAIVRSSALLFSYSYGIALGMIVSVRCHLCYFADLGMSPVVRIVSGCSALWCEVLTQTCWRSLQCGNAGLEAGLSSCDVRSCGGNLAFAVYDLIACSAQGRKSHAVRCAHMMSACTHELMVMPSFIARVDEPRAS